jgi:glyoxylase-like metal-dependent hydrolase (beta-lactamase superfamily II)
MNSGVLPRASTAGESVYEVYALRYARHQSRRAYQNFVIGDGHDWPMPMDYNVWIIVNQFRVVLVDTGFGERAARSRGRILDVDPMVALKQLGINPDEISDVVLTHLHYDHAGNLDRLAHAQFHVQDAEVAFATGRCMCAPHIRLPYDVEDIAVLIRHLYGERLTFHDGHDPLLPGIGLLRVPGHSPGMQAVSVQTARGKIILASDASHYYANILRRDPFLITTDTRDTIQSYQFLLNEAGTVSHLVPGHDPKVRTLYPLYVVNGVGLSALHEPPREHDVDELARLDNFEAS